MDGAVCPPNSCWCEGTWRRGLGGDEGWMGGWEWAHEGLGSSQEGLSEEVAVCSWERTDGGALTRAFQPPELRDDVQGSHWPGFVMAPERPTRCKPHEPHVAGAAQASLAAKGMPGRGRRAGTWLWGTCPFLG